MGRTRLGLVALTLASFALPACGGGSSDEKADDDVDYAEVLKEALLPVVEAQCNWTFRCCDDQEAAFELGPFTPNAAQCVIRTLGVVETGQPPPGVEDTPVDSLLFLLYGLERERVSIDEDAIAACAQAGTLAPCNGVPNPELRCDPSINLTEDPCDPESIFIGKQQVGEDCNPEIDIECAPGLGCVDTGDRGVCGRKGEIGDFCFQTEDCLDSLYCDFATGLCADPLREGEPCEFFDPGNPVPGSEVVKCKPGLSCDPDQGVCVGYCQPGGPCGADRDCPEGTDCIAGRCGQPAPEGWSCFDGEDCESGYCDPADNKCRSALANGLQCNVSSDCESGFCDWNTLLCASKVGLGEPCPTFNSEECEDGFCDTADPMGPTCRDFAGVGENCVGTWECDPNGAELVCSTQVCVPGPLPLGAGCSSHSDCESELCWIGLCTPYGAAGDGCDVVNEQPPCGPVSYCDVPSGGSHGICRDFLGPGELCGASNQTCWGSCVERWGLFMCDDSGGPLGDEAFCDGKD